MPGFLHFGGMVRAMKAILFVSALALVGCSKKSEESGGDPCAAAINPAIDKMVGARKDAPPEMTEIANKLRTLMTQHCRDNKWPDDVIACFKTASDQPSIKKCRQMLPQELAQKLQIDIMKAMTAGSPREKAREHMSGHGGMGGGSGGGVGGGEPAAEGSAGSADVPAGTKQ